MKGLSRLLTILAAMALAGALHCGAPQPSARPALPARVVRPGDR